ncbi:MAG TPA: carboxylating nicotinate-nucleotide diphosphorylase [Dissulfurispiraceae bacterium]|nr:carboxylating nicotinate-nucleotide diphosphorylase [Dissulfurispiraceae bacterium]
MMVDLSVAGTIRRALMEDAGSGDITSQLTVAEDSCSVAVLVAKESFVLAGMPYVQEVFVQVDPAVKVKVFEKEGTPVKSGGVLAELSGRTCSLLLGERVALNILQRVSGIASLTNSYVNKVKAYPVKITDTRKTSPGLRALEKYGVRMGGGWNHRFCLSDGVLIKDNHIAASGSIAKAVARSRMAHHLLKIEVEVTTLDELCEALDAGADVIMLDNMGLDEIRRAVEVNRKRVLLEVSGGVSLDTVEQIAATGVDIISVGALTHSARAVDISMNIRKKG